MSDLSSALFVLGLIGCFLFVALLVINQKPTKGTTYGSRTQPANESDYDDSPDTSDDRT
jgi:hypothetical protein